MRRAFRVGSRVYKPDNRLGSAVVKADDVLDRSRVLQLVVADGRLTLLDVRTCGRSRLVAVNERTGREFRFPVAALRAIRLAVKG